MQRAAKAVPRPRKVTAVIATPAAATCAPERFRSGGGGEGGRGGGRGHGGRPGGHGHGPGFGRGPWSRARRGDVRAAILLALVDEPMHGYQIMQRLEERSGGAWRPSLARSTRRSSCSRTRD